MRFHNSPEMEVDAHFHRHRMIEDGNGFMQSKLLTRHLDAVICKPAFQVATVTKENDALKRDRALLLLCRVVVSKRVDVALRRRLREPKQFVPEDEIKELVMDGRNAFVDQLL